MSLRHIELPPFCQALKVTSLHPLFTLQLTAVKDSPRYGEYSLSAEKPPNERESIPVVHANGWDYGTEVLFEDLVNNRIQRVRI